MVRLFVGIDLPENVKLHISQQVLPLKSNLKNWEFHHDYHQTLLFIGQVTSDVQDSISKRLEGITFTPFELELSAYKFFNRRIMYIGFTESHELLDLKKRIDLLFPEWSKRDEKDFVPHVTIKRWQRYEFEALHSAVVKYPFQSIKFSVKDVALFKSEKDHHGHKYHVILKSHNYSDRPS